MKMFEDPKLNVVVLNLEDVIATSSSDSCSNDNPSCPYETACLPAD